MRGQIISSKKTKIIVGLMSGTSLDGIDGVLLRVRGSGSSTKMKLIAYREFKFPKGLRGMVLRNSRPESSRVDEITRLNALLGHLYADAVKKLARSADIPLRRIDLIGSHGQTIHHLPIPLKMFGKKIRSTLQIGDPSVVATLTGVTTVGNFRPADMAVGGEGAPLVPYFDWLMCRSKKKNRILLNIGGIANMTVLPRGCLAGDVIAFDTGPGNMVIDSLMDHFYGMKLDRNGSTASRGMVILDLLKRIRKHRYMNRRPPKSTGREEFGNEFVADIIDSTRGCAAEDVIATTAQATAETVFDAYEKFVYRGMKVDEIFVSGGGAKNTFIMKALGECFSPAVVFPIEELGISSGAKEATCFAILANETIEGHPSNIPRVTGAKKPVILGTICHPTR